MNKTKFLVVLSLSLLILLSTFASAELLKINGKSVVKVYGTKGFVKTTGKSFVGVTGRQTSTWYQGVGNTQTTPSPTPVPDLPDLIPTSLVFEGDWTGHLSNRPRRNPFVGDVWYGIVGLKNQGTAPITTLFDSKIVLLRDNTVSPTDYNNIWYGAHTVPINPGETVYITNAPAIYYGTSPMSTFRSPGTYCLEVIADVSRIIREVNENNNDVVGTNNCLIVTCPTGQTYQTLYRDFDNDGYGSPANTLQACALAGYVTNNQDCDDSSASVKPGGSETCDSKDNNCNGQTDENLGSTTCGTGTCQRTVQNCVNGQMQTCTPGTPAPSEQCNNIDDNCDGSIDEGLDSIKPQLTCGTGECVRSVFSQCQNGFIVPRPCTPGKPTSEVCDGKDNDCDKQTDEELGSTTCGVGECARTVQNCVNGAQQNCVAGTPMQEICANSKDDDCDSITDDDDVCPTITTHQLFKNQEATLKNAFKLNIKKVTQQGPPTQNRGEAEIELFDRTTRIGQYTLKIPPQAPQKPDAITVTQGPKKAIVKLTAVQKTRNPATNKNEDKASFTATSMGFP